MVYFDTIILTLDNENVDVLKPASSTTMNHRSAPQPAEPVPPIETPSAFQIKRLSLFALATTTLAVFLWFVFMVEHAAPFTPGLALNDGWKVLDVESDGYEMRLTLKSAEASEGMKGLSLAITPGANHYLIHALTRTSLPQDLAETIRQHIHHWETKRGQVLLAVEGSEAQEAFFLFIIPVLLIFLFIGTSLLVWIRGFPHYRSSGLIVVFSALLFTLFFRFHPDASLVPIEWITLMSHGWSKTTIQILSGLGIHAGPAFKPLLLGFSFDQSTVLQQIVKTNLWLWGLNGLWFYILALHWLRKPWLATALALLYSINVLSLNAMLSETPAMLLAFLFWTGITALYWIRQSNTHPRLALFGVLILVLATWLTLAIRGEVALFGLVAIALVILHPLATLPPFKRGNNGRTNTGQSEKPFWADATMWALLLTLLAVYTFLYHLHIHSHRITPLLFAPDLFAGLKSHLHIVYQWALDSLNPTHVSFLLLPGLLGLYFPLALVLVAGLGIFHSLKRPSLYAALPIGLALAINIYVLAALGDLRYHFRFLSMLLAPLFLLVVLGFHTLITHFRFAALRPGKQRLMLIIILLTCVVSPSDLLPGSSSGDPLEATGARYLKLLDRNEQKEARFILEAMATHPDCFFVAKTMRHKYSHDMRHTFDYTIWGNHLGRIVHRNHLPGKAALGGSCLLFVKALDCFRPDAANCKAETTSLEPLSERLVTSRAYSPPDDWGPVEANLHLALYRIP